MEIFNIESEIKNLTFISIITITSLCYSYFIPPKLPNSKLKLLSLLPIFIIFTILPLLPTTAFFSGAIAAALTWIANFKLLLFAFDQGPLSLNPPKTLPMFLLISTVGFTVKQSKGHRFDASKEGRYSKKLPLYLSTEIPVCILLHKVSYDYRVFLHPYIVLVSYCCLTFLAIEVSFEFFSLFLRALFGVELEMASDEPYLSRSLQEFWGRRWNLTVTGLLRETVFKPVRGVGGPLVGVMACFVVSGLMHELVLWYVVRGKPTWEMTCFFVVHGVCVVVENRVMVVFARKGWKVPWYVSGPLTVGFVVVTSYWLFFLPLMRGGVDVRIVEEFRYVGEVLKAKVVDFWLRFGRGSVLVTG